MKRLLLLFLLIFSSLSTLFAQEYMGKIAYVEHKLCDTGLACAQNIKIINLDSGESAYVETGALDAESIHWSPDYQYLSYIDQNATLHILDAESYSELKSIAFDATIYGAISYTWSPDSSSLAIVHPEKDTQLFYLSLYDIATGELTAIVETLDLAQYTRPQWSPDGSSIAVAGPASAQASEQDIYIIDVAANSAQRLGLSGFSSSPEWSSDGQFIAYTIGQEQPKELVIADVAMKQIIALFEDTNAISISNPRWVIDDSAILYFVSAEGFGGGNILVLYDLAKAEAQFLYQTPLYWAGYDLSPDRTALVFNGGGDTEQRLLCIVNLITAAENCLEGENPYFLGSPAWADS